MAWRKQKLAILFVGLFSLFSSLSNLFAEAVVLFVYDSNPDTFVTPEDAFIKAMVHLQLTQVTNKLGVKVVDIDIRSLDALSEEVHSKLAPGDTIHGIAFHGHGT